MDDAAERVQYLIGLVQNTRSLVLQLSADLADGTTAEVVYAARALHETRLALAKTEVEAETLAAAHRAGRREKVLADLRKAWDAGKAEGSRAHRRDHPRDYARSMPFRALRAVTMPLRLDRDQS
jgi:hypothetical protein